MDASNAETLISASNARKDTSLMRIRLDVTLQFLTVLLLQMNTESSELNALNALQDTFPKDMNVFVVQTLSQAAHFVEKTLRINTIPFVINVSQIKYLQSTDLNAKTPLITVPQIQINIQSI